MTVHVNTTSSGKASWFVGNLIATGRLGPLSDGDDVVHLFTDVRGQNPNKHAGEDADNIRFLVEGTAASYGIRSFRAANLAEMLKRRRDAAHAVAMAREEFGDDFPGLEADAVTLYARYLNLRDFAAPQIPGLVWLVEGRDIWQVFEDDRFLGNSRLANCSKFLKQKPARDWLDANCDPDDTIVYVGIDLNEDHRLPDIQSAYAHPFGKPCARPPKCTKREPCPPDNLCRRHRPCTDDDACKKRLEKPWKVRAPLCDTEPGPTGRPVAKWNTEDIAKALIDNGLRAPRMYAANFEHANCGGGCVRGGHVHWKRLHSVHPDRYRYWEAMEQHLRNKLGADVTILRERSDGTSTPLTLTRFREDLEDQGGLFDPSDFMGCNGCFVDGVTA